MADTWNYYAPSVAITATKNLVDIWNGASSAKTVKLYRIAMFNTQPSGSAITGVMDYVYIYRFTDSSAPSTTGTALTGRAHRSTNTALDANTLGGTLYSANITKTAANVLRQVVYATDEVKVAGVIEYGILECLVPYATIWDSGYGDTNVQPLTGNAGTATGYVLASGSLTNGTADIDFEFTSA